MDIDLLSKMVKELILDNDRVVLPGLGYFAAEIVPSAFSDKGFTINPPYRRLYFRQSYDRDGLLSRLYAESNGTGTDVAEHLIEDFVRGMQEILDRDKVIVMPGLGRLRATKENNYFFVPDEDMDIYPEGAGLEPVSLKNHSIAAVPVAPVPDVAPEVAEPETAEAPAEVPDVAPEVAEPETAEAPAEVPDVAPEVAEQETAGASAEAPEVAPAADESVQAPEPSVPLTEQGKETAAEQQEDSPVQEPETAEAPAEVPEAAAAADESAQAPEPAVPLTEQGQEAAAEQQEDSPVQEPETEPQPEETEDEAAPVPDVAPEVAEQETEEAPAEVPDVAPEVAEPETAEAPAEAPEVAPAVDESVQAPEPAVPPTEQKQETADARRGIVKAMKIVLIVIAAVIALAVIALIAFIILAHTAPEFTDSLLYTPEELEILRY